MRKLHVARETADLTRQVGVAEKEYAEATAEAARAFAPEFRRLSSISRAGYRGHYNTPSSRYMRGYHDTPTKARHSDHPWHLAH